MLSQQTTQQIVSEIAAVFRESDMSQEKKLIRDILHAKVIVTAGAGRMGLPAKAFSMRLGQLGLTSFTLNDSAVPHIGKGDLLVVCSGSGEIATMVAVAKVAKKNKCKIALITCTEKSTIADIADVKIILSICQNNEHCENRSIQPMKTLMEQCSFIYFDSLVLKLMEKLHIDENDMWANHSIFD
jgi:6-phospho-3-hexuloisomerase